MADGDNAPERAPSPPKPQAPDPEIQKLRAEAQEAAALRGQLNQVAEMVQSGRLILKQPEAPKQVEPEDGSALIDRNELRQQFDGLRQQVANVVVETTTQSARQMRTFAKDSLRGKLKNFDKYEGEIDALLERVPDARVAASPETIAQVYKIVRSNHHDEEMADTLAEKKREWEDDLRAKGWTPDEIEEEVDDRAEALREDVAESVGAGRGEREGSRQARPVARSAGVAPAGNASGARLAANRQRAAVPPLTRDERVMADQFGISSAEEYRRYGDPNYRHDSLGFHGKKRI